MRHRFAFAFVSLLPRHLTLRFGVPDAVLARGSKQPPVQVKVHVR